MILFVSSAGCNKARPNYGTFPRVVVELDDPPPPDDIPEKKAAPPKAAPVTSDLPDPPPLLTKQQIDFVLKFDKGQVSVLSHREILLKLKVPTARRVGRFAFELWSGEALIERVRFDFPLLGAGAAGDDDPLERGLTTQTTLRVPFSERANRARILDRKKRSTLELPWPPAQEEKKQGSSLSERDEENGPRSPSSPEVRAGQEPSAK